MGCHWSLYESFIFGPVQEVDEFGGTPRGRESRVWLRNGGRYSGMDKTGEE